MFVPQKKEVTTLKKEHARFVERSLQNRNIRKNFFYSGENIEIKSGWTYNKNGKDKKLEEINKTKWKSVIDANDKIRVLMSKREIDVFVSCLQFLVKTIQIINNFNSYSPNWRH